MVIGGPRRGPRLSTTQPASGVSQVSVAMKIAKAIWMSAMLQPCALFIGLTNRVQAYCRLAIRIMQTMPSHNCDQRLARATRPGCMPSDIIASPETFPRRQHAVLVRADQSAKHAAAQLCDDRRGGAALDPGPAWGHISRAARGHRMMPPSLLDRK